MSSLTTPTRIGRGPMVPGIDTKSPLEKPASALSYGGLHTPPQSAHESRRPSFQYSTLSEAPYPGASTTFNYSQPTTPIHGVHPSHNGYVGGWAGSTNAQPDALTNLAGACSTAQVAEHSLHAVFYSHSGSNAPIVDTTPTYSHLFHAGSNNEFGLPVGSEIPSTDTWRQHEIPSGYATHNTCLSSTLFPLPGSLDAATNDGVHPYDHMSSSFHNFSPHYDPTSVGSVQACGVSSSLYQHPGVVVPSQLSPHDEYAQHSLSHFASPCRSNDEICNSFTASSIDFNDYEAVRPPSPIDAYFAHSEDEGYLIMKTEEFNSPTAGPSSRRPTEPDGRSVRTKRRSSKRIRKASNRTPWHTHELNNCVVHCEGKQCCLQLPRKFERPTNKKPHMCTQCNQGFDRSEHLKRHMGKHSNERRYPCPVPKCGARIGRPDNAGDHFKTHLREKTPGKRNDHVEWDVLHQAIWDTYEDKKMAKKLLDGLQRWIDAGRPNTSGNRKGPS